MAWFQSSNLATFAKSALKEAQKTIDKALEIGEEGSSSGDSSLSSSATTISASEKVAAVTEAASEFFSSWGVNVGVSGGKKGKASLPSGEKSGAEESAVITESPKKVADIAAGDSSEPKSKPQEEKEESIKDPVPVTVTLLPHSQSEGHSLHLKNESKHQRSLSDTVFQSDGHVEGLQVLDLDEPDSEGKEGEGVKKLVPIPDQKKKKGQEKERLENKASAVCDSNVESNFSASASEAVSEDFPVSSEQEHLTLVDLNSEPPPVATESLVPVPDPQPPTSSEQSTQSNRFPESSSADFDTASWSWTESSDFRTPEAEGPPELEIETDERKEEQHERAQEEHPERRERNEPSCYPGIDWSGSSTSQLDSSGGTVLLDHPDETEGPMPNSPQLSNKPSSPLASSIDSPRSSSPPASNEESRASPDHHFPPCSSHPFLPESSRSSSIVVVSSTRASSGGSTGSTASDMHIIDPMETSHSHQSSCSNNNNSNPHLLSSPPGSEFPRSGITGHRKGASSASSSDIEVILSMSGELGRRGSEGLHQGSDPKLYPILSSTHQQTSVDTQEQETQTDIPSPPATTTTILPQQITEEIADMLVEKEEMIEQLREEGEKLSKKQFELDQVIKKLRAKEKENEGTIKGLRGEIAGKNMENERLTKSFVSKETVEKGLHETIQKLTSEKRALELKVEQMQSELEDAKENCASMKGSVEDASVEILELKNAISSFQRDSSEMDVLTREKADLLFRNDSLQKELDSLRTSLNSHQEKAGRRESDLLSQVQKLTLKLHQVEDQLADVSTEVADATMPLSREIERLQSEQRQLSSSFEKREALLTDQLQEANARLTSLVEAESKWRNESESFSEQVYTLESKLKELEGETRALHQTLKEKDEKLSTAQREKEQTISKLEQRLSALTAEVDRLTTENRQLTMDLKSEKTALEFEKKRAQNLSDQLNNFRPISNNTNHQLNRKTSFTNSNNYHQQQGGVKSGENSPNSTSATSESSYLDEVFDPQGNHRSLTPRSFFNTFSSAGLMETLQSNLRQREAEVLGFQEEIKKNERIRKTLNDEIAKLTVRNHEIQMETERLSELQPKLEELETNYNALLQLYGEKVEEADELRLDLADVKEMYKNQIEQLLKR